MNTILNETYTLPNGITIPDIGLGTWLMDDKEARQATCQAIQNGYRHIDTAQAYGNEHGVGQGIQDSGVRREDIFVTTKLAAEAKDYDTASQAIDESLEQLGLDYIDLMIIHSPQPWDSFREGEYAQGNREAWRALENAYNDSKLRAIGVSNFRRTDIDNILSACTVKPMVNQVLAHIGNTPLDLFDYCKSQGMLMEAYSPIAHGTILADADIAAMAERYHVSPAQLCIRYTLQLGAVALPKTADPEHMRQNADVDFAISDEDMGTLMSFKPLTNYGEYTNFPVYSGK